MTTRTEYLRAKVIVLEYERLHIKEKKLPVRIGDTDKVRDAEKIVRDFVSYFKKPPTYKYVADVLGISKTAAYSRLRNYRHKMKRA